VISRRSRASLGTASGAAALLVLTLAATCTLKSAPLIDDEMDEIWRLTPNGAAVHIAP